MNDHVCDAGDRTHPVLDFVRDRSADPCGLRWEAFVPVSLPGEPVAFIDVALHLNYLDVPRTCLPVVRGTVRRGSDAITWEMREGSMPELLHQAARLAGAMAHVMLQQARGRPIPIIFLEGTREDGDGGKEGK